MRTSVLQAASHKLSVGFWLLLLVLSSTINGSYCKKNKRSDLGVTDGSWKLEKVEPKEIGTLSDLSSGVYSIQVSGGRSQSCGLGSGEFIGFNNRTCSVSLSPSTTAGPVMRQVSASQMWREWIVRVEDGSDGNEKKVTLQAFVDPDVGKKAKCLGYMSTFYGTPSYPNACSTPPYGTGVFLNGTKDSSGTTNGGPRVWSVRAVAGSESQGDFELHASSKPEECARVLSLDGCQARPTLSMMGSATTSQGSQIYPAWKFIRQYKMVSTAPPSPPLPPSPSPTPSGPPFIPGPVISGPSTTSSGYVTVTIKEVGGGNSCSVGSVVLTSTGGAIGSLPATVEVSSGLGQSVQIPVTTDGYNSIYAVGVCTSGVKTEISNGLSVFSSSPGAPSYAYPVTFSLELTGGYSPSNPITDADLKKMCTNLLTEVPGGVCEVVESYLSQTVDRRRRSLQESSYDTLVILTALYSGQSSVVEIFNEIRNSNFTDSLISGLSGNVNSVKSTGIIFGSAPKIPAVSTINVTSTTWTGSSTDVQADGYTFSCSTQENVFGSYIASSATLSGTVTGLCPNTTYYCSVAATFSALGGGESDIDINFVPAYFLPLIARIFVRIVTKNAF